MPVRFHSYIKFLIATCLVVSFCLIEADAQTRRKKRTRRTSKPPVVRPVITNPAIAPPEASGDTTAGGDVKIISTADSSQDPTSATETKKANTPASPEAEQVQPTITSLSNQVDKLNDRLKSMQEDDRYQLDMERLTRAEQRAEQLRSQLMDIQSKIADFESKLEQIEFALRPENIESSTAGYGSTRPEATRDARRKQLEGEKSRTTNQLKLAETSRARLEAAVANADTEVEYLRAKLQQRREQMDAQPGEAPKQGEAPKPKKP